MVNCAQENGFINVFDTHLHRAMLDIQDLCKLIYTIITSNIRLPGVYNVASFNTTVGDIGHYISSVIKVEMKTPESVTKSFYDFKLDTSKVEKVFDFEFQGTLKTIVDSLVQPKTKFEPIENTGNHPRKTSKRWTR